jgi:hypothetical protein
MTPLEKKIGALLAGLEVEMERQNFFEFIAREMDGRHYNYFVSLGYIPGRRTAVANTARGCFEFWMAQIRRDVIWVEDYRLDGTVRFHVVVPLWRSRDNPDAELHWRSFSGGWAISRQVDNSCNTLPIHGLLGYYVMRLNFPLYIGWPPDERSYTQDDFIPWKPKS